MKKGILFVLITVVICIAFSAYAEEDVVDLGDIVIDSSPFDERVFDFPGHVSIITGKDIERSNAKYVYELLRREPGIVVKDFTHVGKTVSVDMRGFGETGSSNVLVLVDGRRINEIDLSNTDWSQIPLENVDHIEILRGSGSVIYGDNAVAGIINIITKKGEGGSTLKGGYEVGSYRYRNYFGVIQGSHDFMSWNFMGKRGKTDGYRLNGDYDGYDFMGSVSIFPEDYLKIIMSGGYHKDWFGLPGGLQRWEIDMLGRQGSTTPNDSAFTESTFLKVAPEVTFNVGESDHTIRFDVWGNKRRVNSNFAAFAFNMRSQIDSKGGSFQYLIANDLGTVRNKLILGADAFTATNRIRSQGFGTSELRIKKETLALYISDNAEILENFLITGGFRQEWAKYRFIQFTPVTRDDRNVPVQIAFDVGGEAKYSEKGAIYARYSRSYRYPKTDEFYSSFSGLNTSIKSQTAFTWEVGVKEHSLKYFQIDAGIFFMDLTNEIYFNPITFANTNYPETRRKGVEIGVRSDINKMIDLFFSYTYTNAYFKNGSFAGNSVPQVPRNKANAGVVFVPFEWVELNFDSEYISSQYHISDLSNHASKLESYVNCNGKVTFLWKGFKVFFGINNIFDQQYSERSVTNAAATVIDFFPSPGRNFETGASWEF